MTPIPAPWICSLCGQANLMAAIAFVVIGYSLGGDELLKRMNL